VVVLAHGYVSAACGIVIAMHHEYVRQAALRFVDAVFVYNIHVDAMQIASHIFLHCNAMPSSLLIASSLLVVLGTSVSYSQCSKGALAACLGSCYPL
jgi:hypothetical protein